MTERRKHPRTPCDRECIFAVKGDPGFHGIAKLVNVSRGGALVEISHAVSGIVGRSTRIYLVDDSMVCAEGVVVRYAGHVAVDLHDLNGAKETWLKLCGVRVQTCRRKA